ncbi:MAG TPA: amidohydrolase family protein [Caulobacteraceae bacterium]|nr:amidohydrolase family protein [Caulobacteraceae bacterium]
MAHPPLIDIHSHVVPQELPADPTGGAIGAWPSVACEACRTKAQVFMGKRPFREIDERSWSPERRIEDMDRDGVAAQALSPMPELLSYWLDANPALELGRYVNHAIGDMVAARPDRFFGLGTVPLQDPELAAKEASDLKARFGLTGVEVGSNVAGAYLGDARFDPFFAACEAEGLAIFVHSLHPLSARDLARHPMLAPFAGFTVDTGLCAASLIMEGVLERFPGLRIGFSHGGGVLAPLLHRMEFGWGSTNRFEGKLPQSPKAYARRFFYDSLVYDEAYLEHLATHIAPGQICLGTDYPYQIQQPDPRGFIAAAVSRPGVSETIWSDAAHRFLGVSAPVVAALEAHRG